MSIPSTGALVVAYRPPLYASAIATPVTAHGISVRPEKNGPGSGQVSITLDDPAYALIQVNDVLAIRREGETVAALLVEMISERTLDEAGGAKETATYSGRLVGAFMEWIVIPPALGAEAKPVEEDALFDWRSNRYDPATYGDTWVDATEVVSVADAKAGDWPTQPMGQDFTESTGAMMIWDDSGTLETADAITVLFYREVTVTGGRYVLEVLMDNYGLVWVDGIQQLEINQTEGYHRASFKRVEMTSGTHMLKFQVTNIDGPAALAYNLFKADHQDHPLPGVAVVAVSDSDTQVMSNFPGTYPGMTMGDDLLQVIAENQALGKLTHAVPSFTVDEDSDGEPWDREIGVTTKTCTTSGLAWLDELAAAGLISRWRWRPDGVTLDVFKPGYTSRPTSVAYPTGFTLTPAPVDDPRSGQVVQLNRRVT